MSLASVFIQLPFNFHYASRCSISFQKFISISTKFTPPANSTTQLHKTHQRPRELFTPPPLLPCTPHLPLWSVYPPLLLPHKARLSICRCHTRHVDKSSRAASFIQPRASRSSPVPTLYNPLSDPTFSIIKPSATEPTIQQAKLSAISH